MRSRRIIVKPPSAVFTARKQPVHPAPTHTQYPADGEQFHNLPAQSTPFIGREQQAAAARQLLLDTDVRLLTLTGPPGIGKTRLALEVAAGLLDAFEHGALLVDLASIIDPALVSSTIAQTLGLRETRDQPLFGLLSHYLRDKQLLLVLDNFEQVVDAAPQVAKLLAVCPKLKILVTSRAALRLTWEHEFPVPPLGLPDLQRLPAVDALADYAAVGLFVERARGVRPDFALSKENARAVAEICIHLDGLPLAIELAAARVKLYPPQAMLGRLQHRLNLLTRGARDSPARHQTLRGAIGWSYDTLGASEPALFRRLSVFVGGCTPEAAQTVGAGEGDLTTDVLEGLESLVDKSLLRQETQPEGGVRFRMLETIREYGLEQLAANREVDITKRRHTAFFVALAERAELALRGPDQRLWLDRLETEHDNLRAALDWSRTDEGGAELGLRLAGAVWRFWDIRGFWREGQEWLEGALARSDGSLTAWRAQALAGAGRLAWRLGDHRRAAGLSEESLALFRDLGDKRGTGLVLNFLGTVARHQEDYGKAVALCEEGLALFRETEDRWGIASVLNNLGAVALHQGDHERAATLCEESLALFRELGSKREIARLLNNLGELARYRGDYGRAAVLYEESLALRELRSKEDIAMSLHNLGHMVHHQGDYGRAAALFRESLALHRELGHRKGIVECLAGLAGVAGSHGLPEQAARLFGAVEALLAAVAGRLDLAERAEYDRNLATVRAALDEEALQSAWIQGRAMTLEQAIEQTGSVAESLSKAAATEELSTRRQPILLTRREQQITTLVAQGLTNREIAVALVITERTAGTHVQHILNKLGFNSRAQIAAWAVEHGLHTGSTQ